MSEYTRHAPNRYQYEDMLAERMVELREEALAANHWLELHKFESVLEDELAWIRGMIKASGQKIRRHKRLIERVECQYGHLCDTDLFYEWEILARSEWTRDRECAHRDELAEGLKALRRLQKEEHDNV